jgi:methionyl-tRNA synthetase
MECRCEKCGMEVKGLFCGKCDEALVIDTIITDNNETLKVAKCPNSCGRIKSPTCCGQDMTCSI